MFQNGDIYSAESVIWSTGFVQNYNWIEIEQAVNEKGFPNHIKGISPVKGLYYIGLPWQSQRGSALICGVGKDAAYVLSEIKNRSVAITTDHPYVHELGEVKHLLTLL